MFQTTNQQSIHIHPTQNWTPACGDLKPSVQAANAGAQQITHHCYLGWLGETVATLEASSTTAKSHGFLGIEWENDLTKKKTFRGNRV